MAEIQDGRWQRQCLHTRQPLFVRLPIPLPILLLFRICPSDPRPPRRWLLEYCILLYNSALYKVQAPLCGPRPCIRSAEPWAKSRPHTTSSLSRHPHPPTQTSCPWHFDMPEFSWDWEWMSCRNLESPEPTQNKRVSPFTMSRVFPATNGQNCAPTQRVGRTPMACGIISNHENGRGRPCHPHAAKLLTMLGSFEVCIYISKLTYIGHREWLKFHTSSQI